MSKGLLITIGILAVIAVITLSMVGRYNGIVGLEEGIDGAWGDVENQYQRRADLIPNLVATVKGYASHESETLEAVVNARARATQMTAEISPETLNDPAMLQRFQAVQDELSSALSRLMVVVERYPDLKANQNFLALQDELAGTENRISVARQRYNEAARLFNSTRRKFPYSLVASDYKEATYFEAATTAREAPQVQF